MPPTIPLHRTIPLNCPNCGQEGATEWNAPLGATDADRTLKNILKLLPGFHWELGRDDTDELMIVCNNCDEFQT